MLNDDAAGIADVVMVDVFGGERSSDRNFTVKIIGVCGAKAGNRLLRLRPRRGKFRMGVNDAADGGEFAVKEEVSVEIGGRAQVAFENSAVEIGEDYVGGREFGVADALGLMATTLWPVPSSLRMPLAFPKV
jgi:hypothetical protein